MPGERTEVERPVVLQISALSLDGRICEAGTEFEAWADPIEDEARDEAIPRGRPLRLESCTPFPSGCVAMVCRPERRSAAHSDDIGAGSTSEETGARA